MQAGNDSLNFPTYSSHARKGYYHHHDCFLNSVDNNRQICYTQTSYCWVLLFFNPGDHITQRNCIYQTWSVIIIIIILTDCAVVFTARRSLQTTQCTCLVWLASFHPPWKSFRGEQAQKQTRYACDKNHISDFTCHYSVWIHFFTVLHGFVEMNKSHLLLCQVWSVD